MKRASRIYLVMSRKVGIAYVGKGADGRIDHEHSAQFLRIARQADATQWESAPFSSDKDALIAEAAAIRILECVGSKMRLLNIQKAHDRRFFPRYPIPFVEGQVKKADLPRAIVVTLRPDVLEDDHRAAPNSPWRPEQLAERARKYWSFRRSRVESWAKGKGAPDVLLAVAKGSARILGAFEIDNAGWFSDPENRKRFRAIPLRNRKQSNFNGTQGMEYAGSRQGGSVTYGAEVA
jgi:hypothetical protein